MDILEIQLAHIRRQQGLALRTADAAPGEMDHQLGFVLVARAPMPLTDMTARTSEALPDIGLRVDTVFIGDEDPVDFILIIEGARYDTLPHSVFDLAYHLRDTLDLAAVEPTLETDFSDWKAGERGGLQPFASMVKGLCFEADEPAEDDSDLARALRDLKVDTARQAHGVSGKGVRIGHVDTGIARHEELANVDVLSGLDLFTGAADGTDPLTQGPGYNPGHGTATASVIVSKGGTTGSSTSGPGKITGVAPDVELIPFRAIKSVVRLTQWRVARAISEARTRQLHIITMSLGGVWSYPLRRAVQRAVEEDIIVLAAAGNCVREVVYPARFDDCIAVAGTTSRGTPWKGTCRGEEIDVSAPGEFVWHASRSAPQQGKSDINPGQGTSFAVALLAGIAALWLERFGRDELLRQARAEGLTLQEFFRNAVRAAAERGQLPRSMGAGLVNTETLLAALPFWVPAAASAERRTAPDNRLALDTMAMLTASEDADFGMARAGGTEADLEALEPVALEAMTRVLIEAQQAASTAPLQPLPAESQAIRAYRTEHPAIGVLIP
jgi:serine protease